MSPSAIAMSRPLRLVRGLLGRTSARTANPDLIRARAMAEPTKPDAPVMKTWSLLDKVPAACALDRSAAPVGDEIGCFLKRCRPPSEGLERGDGVVGERSEHLARDGNAQMRDECCLARAGILSCRLADVLGIAFRVQQVVGNLEGQPDSARIGSQRLAFGRSDPP